MKMQGLQAMRLQSTFRIAPKLAISRKNDNYVTICLREVIMNFFFDFILSLFSGLVNALSFISVPSLVLELRLFTINKWLTRIPKIEYTLVWVLGNIFRLELVTHTKLGTGVPNEMLINAAKRQGYSLSSF